MILHIDEADLDRCLLGHKETIGGPPVRGAIADTVAGVFCIATAVASGFSGLPLNILVTIGLLFTFYGIRNAWHWHDRKCSDRQLFEEIKDMNRTEIRSSLVAVKGCDRVSNRFLLYYDNGWSCDFFPNRKTVDPGDSEIGFLKKYISEEFGISKSDLKLTFVTEKDSEKQCVEHDNEFRYYHYRLYSATLNKLPDGWRERSFVAPNGCKCRWLTVEEMLSDPRIREINYDVVSAIRDYI